MSFRGNKYYKLNRRLLLLVGLWPYERAILKYCKMIFCNIFITISTICQIPNLINLRRNIDLMLKILSPIILCLIYSIKYETFSIIAAKIKYLMEHVERDWHMLKDKKEFDIMEKYTNIGSMCTFGFTLLGLVGIFTTFLLPLLPLIFDILVPLNESRPRQIVVAADYFMDQQKYFYMILLMIDITAVLLVVTLVSTESLYVMYVYHACGMFEVASYRMDQAFNDNLLRAYRFERKIITIFKRIIEAIKIHNRALEFSDVLWSSLAISYSILLMIGVTSLVINLFCLAQAIILAKDLNEIARLITFICGHVVYLFLGNYVAQILIDHSSNIFDRIYFTQWHNIPLSAQKLLLIIMQRSMKSCKMAILGGMFIPSLEGFATLMSTTTSYFTVLCSVNIIG